MPEPDRTDDILDNVIGEEVPQDGDKDMADVPVSIHEQNLTRLSNAGAGAGEHHVTFGKILDLNYEMDRKVASLVQSLGIREVTSQSGQLGVPNAAQQGSAGVKVPGSA